ncbi:hypothetical protein MP638_003883 [Amoeboaphelidium occidentale]|nr:hypothetical protein MP638_003883 [Amoeboaphelidium occidentale]
MKYERELKVALDAVKKASLVTQHVHKTFKSSSANTLTKEDKSPVTVADFSAQAIVNSCLSLEFPNDQIVGEEDSEDLKHTETGPALRQKVMECVKGAGLKFNMEELLYMIDKGKSSGGAKGRFWALDPVDGTKGFIRGEQYAVCLALIEDGVVQVAALGCPNLPQNLERNNYQETLSNVNVGRGLIFGAVKGQGAFYQKLNDETRHSLSVSKLQELSQACFCESVESGHSNHSQSAEIASELGITKAPVRMDSQCKYGMIAAGTADIYLRLPVKKDYQEKIWDHAAGDLIVREAGGTVTDIDGKPLDFSCGRFLSNNRGVVASNPFTHEKVLAALKKVLG